MANKPKIGLEYFPMEVTIFSDIKIRKLIRYQSGKALSVYTQLLCNIYSNGYYLKWDEELPFCISEATGYEEGYISEVIKCCLNIDLFSKTMFEKHKVLTSKGIQERYQFICKILKRKSNISEYMVINSEEMPINSEEIDINSELIPQKKVKEIKEKERKENSEKFFLIPEMERIFKAENPNYISSQEHDFPALKVFAEFISEKKFQKKDFSGLPKPQLLEIAENFKKVAVWYKDKGKGKSLSNLARWQMQEVFNQINAQRTSENYMDRKNAELNNVMAGALQILKSKQDQY